MRIGITERGDAAVHFNEWVPKLDSVDGAIVITKDPTFILENLDRFDYQKCIIHCTITGWGGTAIEPRVPWAIDTLKAYDELVEKLGPDRVVLRIDPIIPVPVLESVGISVAQRCRSRLRVSFLDLYKHVYLRFEKAMTSLICGPIQEVYHAKVHAPLEVRSRILETITTFANTTPEVCGEPDMECSGCVSAKDLKVLGLELPGVGTSRQRNACSCLAVKTELLSHKSPCKHGCLYCYWKG